MTTHWTMTSVDDFVHRLSFDFITQLAKRLESSPINRTEFAQKLGVSKGRVSQILNNPSNLTLNKAVKYARALGMKVSVIAYDDHDPKNENGPINSEIFTICWDKAGRPTDFQRAENVALLGETATTEAAAVMPDRKGFVITRRFARTSNRGNIFYTPVGTLRTPEVFASTNETQPKSLASGG